MIQVGDCPVLSQSFGYSRLFCPQSCSQKEEGNLAIRGHSFLSTLPVHQSKRDLLSSKRWPVEISMPCISLRRPSLSVVKSSPELIWNGEPT